MTRTLLLILLALAGSAHAQTERTLPDPKLTPGEARGELSLAEICATAWGKDRRLVTEAMKAQVHAEYRNSCPSGKTEIDHLISRELGGADTVANLWEQCYEAPVAGKTASQTAEFGAHKKDRLEDDYGKRICLPPSDPMYLTVAQARTALKTDWITAYIERYGDPLTQPQPHGITPSH